MSLAERIRQQVAESRKRTAKLAGISEELLKEKVKAEITTQSSPARKGSLAEQIRTLSREMVNTEKELTQITSMILEVVDK